jgi:hypothetical protein
MKVDKLSGLWTLQQPVGTMCWSPCPWISSTLAIGTRRAWRRTVSQRTVAGPGYRQSEHTALEDANWYTSLYIVLNARMCMHDFFPLRINQSSVQLHRLILCLYQADGLFCVPNRYTWEAQSVGL